jgi:hypoxanthine phosphoribosyltransferase
VITQPVSIPVNDKKILVVDDVVDSGASLRLVHSTISEKAIQIKSAVIYVKPWTNFHPDYYSSHTDSWIIFPWELAETIRNLINKGDQTETDLHPIEAELVKAGVNATIATKILNFASRNLK